MATAGDARRRPPSGGVHITVGAYDGAVLGLALTPAAADAAAGRGGGRRRGLPGAVGATNGGGGGDGSGSGSSRGGDSSSTSTDDDDGHDDDDDDDDDDEADGADHDRRGRDDTDDASATDDDADKDDDTDGGDEPRLALTTRHAVRAHFDGGAGSVVRAVAACGRYAASAGDDGRLALYDTVGGVSLGELPCEAGPVWSLAWAGAAPAAAAAAAAAAATATTPGAAASVAAAGASAAHPTHLLAGSESGSIAVWRVGTWVCERLLAGHTAAVHAMAVHPAAAVALSVAADRRLILWDLVKGERVFWTKVRSAPATAVAWAPDGGRYLLVTDKVVSVYLATGELAASLEHPKRVLAAVFTSPVGVATAGEERVIKLWDSRNATVAATSACHTNRIRGLAVVPGGGRDLYAWREPRPRARAAT